RRGAGARKRALVRGGAGALPGGNPPRAPPAPRHGDQPAMTKRKQAGRCLFYTRDSGGHHENTPAEYVRWARRKAEELKLAFDGTPERIEAMIRRGASADGDLFLDYGVAGNPPSRPRLGALLQKAPTAPGGTHLPLP